LGERRWEPATWSPCARTHRIELDTLGPVERLGLWQTHVGPYLPDRLVVDLAARYRLVEDRALRSLLQTARSRAALRGAARPDFAGFSAAARALVTPAMDGLAQAIAPRYGWDDIVLPPDGLAQLREICARTRHQVTVLGQWGYGRKLARRGGVTALFSGPPGT